MRERYALQALIRQSWKIGITNILTGFEMLEVKKCLIQQ